MDYIILNSAEMQTDDKNLPFQFIVRQTIY